MVPKWLVLIENGIPIGVVHPSRRSMAETWKVRAEGRREIVEVQELT